MSTRRRRVLIVDDDENAVDILGRMLTREGYRVAGTTTSTQCMDLVREFKPDLLVLDVNMPQRHGYDLCRTIRRDDELFPLAIIFASAITDLPEVQYAFEQGGDGYLRKPITKEALLKEVHSVEQLIAEVFHKDPATGMYGIQALKRVVNHRLLLKQSFAVCYFKPVGIDAWATAHGKESGEVTRALAKILKRSLRVLEDDQAFVAQGGGRFLALIRSENHSALTGFVVSAFRSFLEKSNGKHGVNGADSPEVHLHVGVTESNLHPQARAHQLLELSERIAESIPKGTPDRVLVDNQH